MRPLQAKLCRRVLAYTLCQGRMMGCLLERATLLYMDTYVLSTMFVCPSAAVLPAQGVYSETSLVRTSDIQFSHLPQ